ncbi:MAG TPA: hypothetical protein ENK23_05410 [Sorangium sp.]|nr:hypothetical protein [Sorangium sp.]
MADGTSGQALAQSFDNSAPAAAKSSCCKNVKGEWEVIPKLTVTDIKYLGPGDVKTTYYFKTIPKGFKLSVRVRVKGRIKGTLVCKCLDDGRVLSKTKVDKPFSADGKMPVYSTNVLKKVLGPGVGWVLLAIEVIKAGKKAYDFYTKNPEFVKAALKMVGPAAKKAIEVIKNSADSLCKHKHKEKCKPAKPKPAPPAEPDPSMLIS